MTIDEELRPLHQLTKLGDENYKKFLEEKADEILFKYEHPLQWAICKVKEIMRMWHI